MSKANVYLSWAAQIAAAAILAIALVPKLLSDPQAIQTFTTLGVEPWGRYLTAILELVAVVLLVVPQLGRHAVGGLAAVVIMVGALGSHVWRLGFSGEMATMAGMATVVLIAGLVVLYARREELLTEQGQPRLP